MYLESEFPLATRNVTQAGRRRRVSTPRARSDTPTTTKETTRSGAAEAIRHEDVAWVRRVQDGDQEAASALIERLHPTIARSVRCHRPRHVSDEDLTQAVFVKVFSKIHQYSGLVPLEHWVSRIAVNTCMSQLSREKGRPELRMSDLNMEDQGTVEFMVSAAHEPAADSAADANELLSKLLAGLKPEERFIVTQLHLEEKTTQQIRQGTGWSVSRIKVKAFRARNKMRKLWKKLAEQCKSKPYDFGC